MIYTKIGPRCFVVGKGKSRNVNVARNALITHRGTLYSTFDTQ